MKRQGRWRNELGVQFSAGSGLLQMVAHKWTWLSLITRPDVCNQSSSHLLVQFGETGGRRHENENEWQDRNPRPGQAPSLCHRQQCTLPGLWTVGQHCLAALSSCRCRLTQISTNRGDHEKVAAILPRNSSGIEHWVKLLCSNQHKLSFCAKNDASTLGVY